MMNRRSFLQSGFCAAAAASLCPLSASAIAEYKKYEKRIPIGLQLYSLRDVINHETFPKYIKWVAETGFEFVEFAGYHGYSAKELRTMLDDVGLKASSTHTGFDSIKGDNLKATADFANEVGFKFLIVPGGLEGRIRASEDSNKRCAEEMSECAEEAAKLGVFVGFHGHSGDFQNINGTDKSAWVTFFNNCDPRVIAQVDVGWCSHAHSNGQKLNPSKRSVRFRRGRLSTSSRTTRFTDALLAAPTTVDWKPVFEAAHEVGGAGFLRRASPGGEFPRLRS